MIFSTERKIDWWILGLKLVVMNANIQLSYSGWNCSTQKISIEETRRVRSTIAQTIKTLRKTYFSLITPPGNPIVATFENLEKVNK